MEDPRCFIDPKQGGRETESPNEAKLGVLRLKLLAGGTATSGDVVAAAVACCCCYCCLSQLLQLLQLLPCSLLVAQQPNQSDQWSC